MDEKVAEAIKEVAQEMKEELKKEGAGQTAMFGAHNAFKDAIGNLMREAGKRSGQGAGEALKGMIRGTGEGIGEGVGQAVKKQLTPDKSVTEKAIDFAKENPLLTAGGAGIGAYQGSKLMAGIGREVSQPREKHLQKIKENVPEIEKRHDEEKIRKYWGSMKSLAPEFAKQDPHTAGRILLQMLEYEGIDQPTINRLLETEEKIREQQFGETDTRGLTDLADKLASVEEESESDYDAIKSLRDD